MKKKELPNENEIKRLKAQLDKKLNNPAADQVPDSLLPHNIGALLGQAEQNKNKTRVIKFPVWQRYGAIAAAFLLIVAAFAILPNLQRNENVTLLGDTAQSAPNNTPITALEKTAGKDYSAVKTAFEAYSQKDGSVRYGWLSDKTAGMDIGAPEAAGSKATAAPQESGVDDTGRSDGKDYSTTNVQVEGVDEADIVKTDGEYIYFVVNRYYNNSTVAIAKTNGGELQKVWELKKENFTISEIFLSDGKLVLLMQPNSGYYRTFAADTAIMANTGAVRVEIYDLADKANPSLTRSFEQEGNYTNARVSNGKLLLITCKYAYHYLYGVKEFDAEAVIPHTMDSVVSDKMTILPPEACYILPRTESLSFGTVSTVDLIGDAPAQSVTVMGDIATIYANAENVYVTANRYEYEEKTETTSYGNYMWYNPLGSYTDITKLAYSGTLQVIATGTVNGGLCSQFAMDEFEGNLRVATNSWDYQNNNKQYNNFYVLDGNMKTIGKLEGLAEGENMYGVRFEGKKAYAVTYRQVDPFFVINLEDPSKPYVQGELKIPGFSQYLHPYADNLMIGFGMDAVEDVTGTTGLIMGFKVAMYDVSDPSSPKELSTYYIGDRGTHSDLSYDHKALLFDKEKNIVAFPISITKVKDGADIREYGATVFTGYIVLGYDAQKGFFEKGRITHSVETSAETEKYRYDMNITRGLYIGDVIYTLSNSVLAANKLSDFTEISRIQFETPQYDYVEPIPASEPVYVSSEVSKAY